MNLETFRATRKHVANLADVADIPAEYFEDEDGTPRIQPGFVYDGDMYIEDHGDTLHMLLGRDSFSVPRAELPALELRLYDWACGEFYTDAEDEKAARLAVLFATVLGAWLEPEEFAEMRARNAKRDDANVCHSHDFCDANEAMAAAWVHAFDCGPDMASDDDTALWNQAWQMAAPLIVGAR